MKKTLYRLILILLLLITGVFSVQANQNGVPQFATTGGYRVTTTTDSNDGTCDSHCSLREAIIAANNDTGMNPIVYIPNGTYTLTLAGAGEDAAATGDLDITRSMSIIGEGRDTTIIDGNGTDRIFDVHGTSLMDYFLVGTPQLIVSDLSIQNGLVIGENGGGMRLTNEHFGRAYVILMNVSIKDSQADNGGGLHTLYTNVDSYRLHLINNIATNKGGGLFFEGVHGYSISHNHSGIIIESNTAQQGGGAYLAPYITNEYEHDRIYLSQAAVVNNTAQDGGGLYFDGGQDTTFSGTISGNEATNNGGGIFINGASGMLSFMTLTNNTADSDANGSGFGGAISASGANMAWMLPNNVIWGNFVADVCEDCTGTDPLLLPLADNGGDTLTHALQANSPLIESIGCTTDYDQRGVVRNLYSENCEPGAYAYAGGTAFADIPSPVYVSYTGNFNDSIYPPSTTDVYEHDDVNSVELFMYEPMLNIENSTTNPAEVDNPTNYRLLNAGIDGVFQTLSCDATLGDDEQLSFSVAVDNSKYYLTSYVHIIPNRGERFFGQVRLLVCDEITDQDGNALDGNLDDLPGGDAQFDLNFGTFNQTLTVTTTEDVTDGVCDSHCSLRDAIRVANTAAAGITTEIVLPSGTYNLSLTGAGEDAAVTGDLDVTKSIAIIGASRDTTIIDGMASDRIFHATVPLLLQSLTLRNGVADMGGAIYSSGAGHLQLYDVLMENNSAGTGGAVRSSVEVYDSEFKNNLATLSDGGAIRGGGSIYNTVFTGNNAAMKGSAVYSNGDTFIYNSTFSGNVGDESVIFAPGYIYFSTIADNESGLSGFVTVINTILANNGAANCSGTNIEGYYSISDDASCNFGTSSLNNTDPLLLPLDTSGTSPVYPLAENSPARNILMYPECVTLFDQLGNPRNTDGLCDIGAFEGYSDAPLNFTVTGTTSTSVSLDWDDVAGATWYHLERYDTATQTWVNSGSTLSSTTAITVTNLFCETTYQFRMRASYSATTFSMYTQPIEATTGACSQPPTANIVYNCLGLACSFNGTFSSDTNGTIIQYDWDFGDNGATASNAYGRAGHVFSAAATYPVALTVTDDWGITHTTTTDVTVSESTETTFTVNSTADTNDGICNIANCTIRDAIDAAQWIPNGEIYIPDGTYTIATPLKINNGLIIRGQSRDNTIINGGDVTDIFHLSSPAGIFDLTLSDISFEHGLQAISNIHDLSNLTLLRTNFSYFNASTAIVEFGGIDDFTLLIEKSSFTHNTSNYGLFAGGIGNDNAHIIIRESFFGNNDGLGVNATGILRLNGSNYELLIERSSFVRNMLTQGRRLFEISGSNLNRFEINNSTFANNGNMLYSPSATDLIEITVNSFVLDMNHVTMLGNYWGIEIRTLLPYQLNVFGSIMLSNDNEPFLQCPSNPNLLLEGINAYNIISADSNCWLFYEGDMEWSVTPIPLNSFESDYYTEFVAVGPDDSIPADECSLDVDQRGVSRPIGGGCDMGAIEDDVSPIVPVPANFIATNATGTAIDLQWDDIAGETEYWLERSQDNGATWIQFIPLSMDMTAYHDSVGLTCDTIYWYRLRAYDDSITRYSAYTPVLEVMTAPCSPTGLSAVTATHDTINIQWVDNSSTETNYRVERSTDGGDTWTEVASRPANSTSHSDTGLTCDTSYQYKVRAYRDTDSTYSEYSVILAAATTACLQTGPVFTVTTTDGANAGIGGACYVNACNLGAAIYAARNVEGGVAYAPAGTYLFSAPLVIDGDVNILGDGAGQTIFDAQGITHLFESDANAVDGYDMVIDGVTLTNAYSADHSAILYDNPYRRVGSLTIRNGEISDSVGKSLIVDISLQSTFGITLENTLVTRNMGDRFGYIELSGNGVRQVTIRGSVFIDNDKDTSLGTLLLSVASNEHQILIEDSAFVRNGQTNGSSLFYITGASSTPITISNSTFSENISITTSESIANVSGAVSLILNHLTITDNIGTPIYYNPGGGAGRQLTGFGNIISGNDGEYDLNCRMFQSQGYNILGNLSLSCVAGASDIITDDPMLLSVADNGGNTWTNAPQLSSPAIDAIPAESCTEALDQRGVSRPQSIGCDIGAYEATLNYLGLPAPTNLSATAASYQAIDLSWEDNATNESNYVVERSLDGSTWTALTPFATNTVAYTDSGLDCDTTYQYQVRAYRSADDRYSDYTNIASATTAPCMPVPVLGTVTINSIEWSWNDVLTETEYRLERSNDGGTTWTEIAQPAQNVTTYTDNTVVCETSYVYQLRAYRSTDNLYSQYSDPIPVTTAFCPLVAPTGLRVTATTATTIDLQWSEANSSETAILLERSDDGLTWVQIVELAASTTTHQDTSLTCETIYDYRVRAYRADDESTSEPSNTVSPMTGICPVPNPPTNLQVTATNARSVDLLWTDNDISVTRYTVERSNNNGASWQAYPVLGDDVTTFTANNLTCQTNWQFRVRGVRLVDNQPTGYSNTVTEQTLPCPALVTPNAPVVTGFNTVSVSLSLTTDATGEVTNWQLERLAGGNWQHIATLPVTTTQYTDNNLSCSTGYSYRVRAYRAEDGAVSAYSAETPVTTETCAVPFESTVGLYRNGLWIFTDTNATGTPDIQVRFGPQQAGWHPIIGDWDGDGVDGIGVYRNGLFLLRNTSDSGIHDTMFYFGYREAGWQPIVGDWNGDGTDTVGVYKAGSFMLTNDHATLALNHRFTLNTIGLNWVAIAGDWDGNGADSVGLYTAGSFMLTNNVDASVAPRRFSFGPTTAGWYPVAGDWNTDGADTIGIYSQSIWRLRNSNTTGTVDIGFNFGQRENGWIPLASYRGGVAPLLALSQAANVTLDVSIEPTVEVTIAMTQPPVVEITPEATVEVTTEITATSEVVITPEATADVTVMPTETPVPPEPTVEPTALPTETPLPEVTDSPPEVTQEASTP